MQPSDIFLADMFLISILPYKPSHSDSSVAELLQKDDSSIGLFLGL